MNESINISSESKKTTTPTSQRQQLSCNRLPIPFTNRLPQHRAQSPSYFPRGNYYVRPPHRTPPCTEAKSPPAAGCRCLQPTSFFLSACRAVCSWSSRQTYTKEPDRTARPRTDDDRHTHDHERQRKMQNERGSQFAHILDGSPRGLPDLHPVRPRPRLGTKRKAVNHYFCQSPTNP